MKKVGVLILFVLLGILPVLSQKKEKSDLGYQVVYEIFLCDTSGEVKHIIPEKNEILVKAGDKKVAGRWVYKSMPDMISIVNEEGEMVGRVELNEQVILKIVSPTPNKGDIAANIGSSVAFGVDLGPNYSSFKMINWSAEINERLETKEEKVKREYEEMREQKKLDRIAAKKVRMEARQK